MNQLYELNNLLKKIGAQHVSVNNDGIYFIIDNKEVNISLTTYGEEINSEIYVTVVDNE